MIYSLVAICKLNDHDPFAYFRNVLQRVSTPPTDKIDELLPSNWKKSQSDTEDGDIIKEQMTKVA